MADTPVQITLPAGQTGLTLTLVSTADAVTTGSPYTLTERTNASGVYDATVSDAVSGDHVAVAKTSGGSVLATGWVRMTDDTTAREVVGSQDELDRSTFNAASDEVTTDAASRTASQADVSGLSTFDASSDEVTTDAASRTASQADLTGVAQESTLTAMQGTGFDGSTDALKPLRDKVDTLSTTAITGAHTVTITVEDDLGGPLENAKVKLTEGVTSEVMATDANGQVTFDRDDATYDIAATKAGFTFAGDVVTVSGSDVSKTITMTPLTISAPATPAQATGVAILYDENGDIKPDAKLSWKLVTAPDGSDGSVFDARTKTAVADVNGQVQDNGFWRGARYQVWRGKGAAVFFTVPDAASFNLPALAGSETEPSV